ncbi:MFS transporter [Rhizobium halophytocola]|uniref:MFS family permease n=1 Tax=Rhizobium halophytocola TaxID=735519 RepID=A0ABS4DW50_9HYPH|nr:MFS transporter [Rhizobium halophytocola]MBP1849890.1 MFS family permease [Rhizobium halophytocola]
MSASHPDLRSAALARVAPFGFATTVTFYTVSGAPTPLYHLYQQAFGFSALTLTVIFAAYVVSLLLGLLFFGSLSDYLGRKPVIVASLAINVAALAAFLLADGADMLILARFLQGLGTGIAIPALGAQILDADPKRGPVLNSTGAFLGLMIGTLLSAVLVTYAPYPMHLVYGVLLAVITLEALALVAIPETITRKAGALASLKPRIAVPASVFATLMRVTPVNIAGWALGGFYLSLMPSLVSAATGNKSVFVGGGVVSALMLSALITGLATRGTRPTRVLAGGSLALILGVATTLTAVAEHQVGLMFAGTVIAGFGFGGNFGAILRIVLPLADQNDRAALLSTFFVESYLAFSLPAIAAGLAAPHIGLALVTYIYGAAIVVLASLSLAGMRQLARTA